MTHHTTPAQAEGLYDPRFEHDACGVAMVARLDDEQTHDVVRRALEALDNLEHRGAEGADVRTGDGAGILLQIPDAFLRAVAGVELPPPGRYGVGMCFLPARPGRPGQARGHDRAQRARRGPAGPGLARRAGRRGPRRLDRQRVAPLRQAAVHRGRREPGAADGAFDQDAFERKLYVIRRIVELAAGADVLRAVLLLAHAGLQGHAHRRTSCGPSTPTCRTSASPARWRWSTRASRPTPSRAGNSPIRSASSPTTARSTRCMGNVNWMRARESQLASELFGDDLQKTARRSCAAASRTRPRSTTSSSCCMLAGRSLPHAMMMMIPEACAGRDDLSSDARGLLRLPLLPDGAVGRPGLDRLHRRPRGRRDARPQRAAAGPLGRRPTDGHVILAPRPGCSPSRRSTVTRKGRLPPGKIFLVDLERGRIVEDGEIKDEVADPAALRRVARASASSTSTSCPSRPPRGADDRAPLHDAPARLRLHPGGPARPAGADGDGRRGADRLDGQRHSRWRCSPTAAARSSPTSSSSSRRSPTRRSTRCASSSSCRSRPASAPSATCSTRRPSTPPAVHGPADPAQRRARAAARRDQRRLPARTRSTSPGRGPTAPRACERRRWHGLRRGGRRDRRRGQHPHPLRPRRRAGAASRSRRCSPWRRPPPPGPRRASACAPGSSSSPASRARSTTSRR